MTEVIVDALEPIRAEPDWVDVLFDCALVLVGESIGYFGRLATSGDDKASDRGGIELDAIGVS